MSLNQIQITNQLIADLYKTSLVEMADKPAPLVSSVSEQAQWKFLGENKKNILIIVNYQNAVYLPDKDLSFLTKLLMACSLNLGDVAVINIHNYPGLNFNDPVSNFQCKNVFLFGVGPETIGMPVLFPHFQIQNFKNCAYLFTPALQELESDKLLKSKFWVCLKKIFNL